MLRITLILVALTAIQATRSQAANMQNQSAAAPDITPRIDAANKAWLGAYAKGDAAVLTELYTDTATVLPLGGDMVSGHDAVRKFWKATIDSGLKITTLTTVSIDRHGPFAVEIGRFTGAAPGTDKQMVHIEGKYVVYWKQTNGMWKLDADIWNMNK